MKMRSSARYIFIFILFFVLWEVGSAVWKNPILPSPAAVLLNLKEKFLPKIAIHAALSAYRIAAGLVLSVLIGSVLGLLMGYYDSIDRILSPLIYFTYPIPKISLLPVVMILFGLGETSKITMIVIISVFQVIITARDTVKNIPKETYYSLKSLGADDRTVFREVILPAALPELLTAIKLSAGTAASVLFFTESFGTTHGMGYLIMDSWMRVNYLDMYSGILVLSLMGMLIFLSVDALYMKFCRWKR